MQYEEVQNNEIEALKAIYGSDFREIPVQSVWNQRPAPKFQVTLRPSSDFKESPIEVTIQITMTPTYPNTKPQTEIVRSSALSGRQTEILKQSMAETVTEMLQNEMIFEVTSNLQNHIDEWARSVAEAAPSLEEDRLRRLEIEEAKQSQRQDELQRQREMAAKKEEQKYDSLILEEIEKNESEGLRKESSNDDLRALVVVPENTYGVTTFERVVEIGPPFTTFSVEFRQVMTGLRVLGPKFGASYIARALFPPTTTATSNDGQESDLAVSLMQIDISSIFWRTSQGTRALHDLNTELETMKSLTLPGVVPLSEFSIERTSQQEWRINVLSPLSRFTPLSEVLNNTGTISLKTTQSWTLQILEALEGLHKRGIRHKMICSYNVMINSDVDTGETSVFLRNPQYLYSLQALNEQHSFSEKRNGSTKKRATGVEYLTDDVLVFLPPEYLRKRDASPSSKWDMWQLGALIVLMVVGKSELERSKWDPEALIRSKGRKLPSAFSKFVLRMLHSDPAKRPGALELLTDEFFRTNFDFLVEEDDVAASGVFSDSHMGRLGSAAGGSAAAGYTPSKPYANAARSTSPMNVAAVKSISNLRNPTNRNIHSSSTPNIPKVSAGDSAEEKHDRGGLLSAQEANQLGSTGRRRLSSNDDGVFSRYKNDFDEGVVLGKGGFGQVVKARNKLDGRVYAVKKISATPSTLSHILQEVVLLSRLNHQYVVRYYTVWLEDEADSGNNTNDADADLYKQSSESSAAGGMELDSLSRTTLDKDSELSNQSIGDAIPSTSLSQFSGHHSLSELDLPSVSQDFMSDSGFIEFGFSDSASEAVMFEDSENNGVTEIDDGLADTAVDDTGDDNTIDNTTESANTMEQSKSIATTQTKDAETQKRKERRAANERTLTDKIAQITRKTLYIQMEYCENHTLGDLVRQSLYKDPKEYWRLLRQILDALSYIHGEGVIHRDLKPKNIFIDQARNIKIGDFGLARSMVRPLQSRQPSMEILSGAYTPPTQPHNSTTSVSASASDYEEFTTDVGTSLYAAPEITDPNSKRGYNEKVDIFSLGIILFEMAWKMDTEMERILDIKRARLPQIELPKELMSSKSKSVEVGLIKCMLDHNPDRRPSAQGLLKSGRIPVEESDMTVVEALHNMRDQRVVQQIVNALFSRPLVSAQQVLYDRLNISTSTSQVRRAKPRVSDTLGCMTMTYVEETLRSVFMSHGAVDNTLFRSRIFPRSPLYKGPNVVEVIDEQGTVLQLPYDLTMAHARRLAEIVPNYKKAYSVDTVFRNRFQNPGQHPAKHIEVDFDIISTDDSEESLIHDEAETISTMYDSAHRVLSLGEQNDLVVVIGHHDILSATLSHCGLTPPQFHAALVLLASGSLDRRNNATLARSNVSSANLDMLSQFAFRESFTRSEARMSRLMPLSQRVRRGLARIRAVAETFKRMCATQCEPQILFSPLVHTANSDFFINGTMFQLVDVKNLQGNARQYNTGSILAMGGRYDSLVQSFRNTLLDSRTPLAKAVGFGMSADKLEMMVSKQLQQQLHAPNHVQSTNKMLITPRCQVLISSLSDTCLRDQGVDTARVLWSIGISTDFVWGVSSNDDVVAEAQEGQIPLVIMIKQTNSHTALSSSNTFKPLRIKRVAVNTSAQSLGDVDLTFSELIPFIQNELSHLELNDAASSGPNLQSPLAKLASMNNSVAGEIVNGMSAGSNGNSAGSNGSSGNSGPSSVDQVLSANKVLVLNESSKLKGGRKNRWQLEEKSAEARTNFLTELSNAPIISLDLRDEVIQAILNLHPSAIDDWKRRVVGISPNQKAYILTVQAKLANEATRSPRMILYSLKTENVFVYNY